MNETMVRINVNKLYPHPNNPRNDLGDLTELTASIAESGILQNLTVVPAVSKDELDTYTVVIGHRRLAAAKKAGLNEVPCIITDMDKKQQVATMLMENMQRNDLTLPEQAQGFQLMLDLGNSIADISKLTGLSDSTVRRRVNLLKLDQNEFCKAVKSGATLMDFAKLEEIHDDERRNEVLKSFNTNDFNWKFWDAIEDQKWGKRREEILDKLRTHETEVTDEFIAGSELRISERINKYTVNQYRAKGEDDQTQCFYRYNEDRDTIELYKVFEDVEDTDEDDDDNKRHEEKQTKKEELHELEGRAYGLRKDFITSCNPTKEQMPIILTAMIETLERGHGTNIQTDRFEQVLPNKKDHEEVDYKALAGEIANSPYKYLLYMAYAALENKSSYLSWDNEFKVPNGLDKLYRMIEALGYTVSDEEKMLHDGTHSLYKEIADLS